MTAGGWGAVRVTRGAVTRLVAGGRGRGAGRLGVTDAGWLSRGALSGGAVEGGPDVGGIGTAVVAGGRPTPRRRWSGGAAGSVDRLSHTPPAPSASTMPAAAARRRPTRRGSGSSSMMTIGEPGPRRGLSENRAARCPAPGDVPPTAPTKSSTVGNRSVGRLLSARRSASETCAGISGRTPLRSGIGSFPGGLALKHSYASAANAYWSAVGVGPRALKTSAAVRPVATTSATAKSPTRAHSFASSITLPDESAPWNTPRRCA